MGFSLPIYATNIPNFFSFLPHLNKPNNRKWRWKKKERKKVLQRGCLKRVFGWENKKIYIHIKKQGNGIFFSGIRRKLSRWKLCLIDSSLRKVEASFLDNLAGAILAVFHQSQGFSPFLDGRSWSTQFSAKENALMYFCGGTRRSPPEFLAELCSDEEMSVRLHSGNMKLFSLMKCH